tara:strand:- start:3722 stop:4624 length:903 start_codon:yes stop_codon:yes gene_type:complete
MQGVLGDDRMRRYEDLDSIIRNPAAPMAEREAAQKALNNIAIESDFNTLATKTPRGRVSSIRPFGDPDTWAEYPPLDPSHLSALPEDVYSWRDPSAVDLAGKPFRANETSEILRAAAKRLGYPEEGLSNKEFLEAASETPYSKPIRGPYDEWVSDNVLGYRGSEFTDKARKLIDEVQNDPRFQPSKRVKAIRFLKGAAKEALRPKNIITDALIGSVVGAGSAVAGYEWSRPRSAGMFTAPGPGYEDALTQADILEVAEGKELEKKARLEQYIEEALATGARIPADPRIEDLAEVLGPIRW